MRAKRCATSATRLMTSPNALSSVSRVSSDGRIPYESLARSGGALEMEMNSRQELSLPRRPRGRPTPEAQAVYEAERLAWCEAVKQINRTLSFRVGTRGWCYILEAHGLAKGDFNKAESFMTECRKLGLLPLD